MKRCAFLSTDNLEEFFVYDELAIPYLNELGWQVEEVSWRDPSVNYDKFDMVVVRSTWDYQADVEPFIACLKKIDASSTQLENPLSLMLWNISKTYLRELALQGVSVLPTLWFDNIDKAQCHSAFEVFKCSEIVIKPLVSANADDTFRLDKAELERQWDELKGVFSSRAGMIQAFEKSIVEEGEFSLFYFNNRFSHAILKIPQEGDFRVQEEHGGSLQSVEPNDEIFDLANKTLNALPHECLFARLDIVKANDTYAVIELELIEPSLYFNMDKTSPKQFAQAINDKYQNEKT